MFVVAVLAGGTVLACGEDALPPTDPGSSLQAAAGLPGGFGVVQVRPNAPANAQGAVTNNLADAVSRVASGGTVRVHAGTYVTHDVLIDKPVTIEGNGDPLIVNRTGSASLVVGGIGSGEVTIRGITFRDDVGTHASGPAASIALVADFGHVIVESSTFSGVAGETRPIYQRVVTSTAVPTLTVRGSAFESGFRAVNIFNFGAGLDVEVLLEGNDVRDFSERGFYLTSASGVVRDNDFTNCGLSCVLSQVATSLEVVDNRFEACISNAPLPRPPGLGAACVFFVFGEDGIVRGNAISDRTHGRGSHAAIIVSNFTGLGTAGRFLVENNVVDGCGDGNCIVTDGDTEATIRGNHVTAYAEDDTEFGITSSGLSEPGDDVIEDNVLVGVSDPTAHTHQNQAGFGFFFSGIFVHGVNTAKVSRNTVSGANWGIFVTIGGVVEGTDNVIPETGIPIAVSGPVTITLNQSDFTQLDPSIPPVGFIPVPGDPPASGVLDLTCNWWGDAGGPGSLGTVPAGVTLDVVPFATSPIAGTGATSCSGGLP